MWCAPGFRDLRGRPRRVRIEAFRRAVLRDAIAAIEVVRAFRIVDGADEVNEQVIFGDALDVANPNPADLENVPTC